MLEAYFDESGTHNNSDAVTVAGFLSSREKWDSFEYSWKAFLSREGIKRFHRVDLESFQKEFSRENGWNEERRTRVVHEAQTIIGDHVLHGFSHSVIKSHYDEVVTDEGLRRRLGQNYYTFCAQACMREIAAWAKANSHAEAIRYVFESGGKGSGELAQLMNKITSKKEVKAVFRFGGLSIADKYDQVIDGITFPGTVQLHAADVLAYEGFKLMNCWHVGDTRRPLPYSYIHLMGRCNIEGKHSDKVHLTLLLEEINSGRVLYL